MLVKQRINPTDYDRFIAFNQRNTGAYVDRTYLEGATVYVHFRPDDPDRWIAAYVINTKSPFRCLSVLLSDHRAALLKQHRISEKSLVEITLLVRDLSTHWLPGERASYYANSIRDALKTGKAHLLGGTTDAGKLPTQMTILDHILFEGDLDFAGTRKHGWLIYTSRLRAVMNAVWHMLSQLIRSWSPRRGSNPTPPLPNG